jgi:hypothetical protein
MKMIFKKKDLIEPIILSVFLLVALILVGLSMITTEVIGVNNQSTITKVWVWNTEPNITQVYITPAIITLIPGNTTQVNCTAFVWDYNGWADVNVTNATFYSNTVSLNSLDSNKNHYTANLSETCNCSATNDDSTANNATCICSFDIWYYAMNGSWTCNMTIQDKAGNATTRHIYFNDTFSNASATINTLVALNVTSEIDYGNLSVTETSTEKTAVITNLGNTQINISVRSYGGTETSHSSNPNNLSMICDYGNISLSYQRYSFKNGIAFENMVNITNTSTLINFTISSRTNDTSLGNSTNSTYWKLNIPLTVGGNCNGTIEFKANDAS